MALIHNPYSLGFCILLASLRKAANPAVPSGPDIYLARDGIRPALSADYCCGCHIDLTYDQLMGSKYGNSLVRSILYWWAPVANSRRISTGPTRSNALLEGRIAHDREVLELFKTLVPKRIDKGN